MEENEEFREFQAKCREAGEVFKAIICKLLGPDEDFEPREVISGAALSICVAHISMRPKGLDRDVAAAKFLAMAAEYLAIATKIDEDQEEEEKNNQKKAAN